MAGYAPGVIAGTTRRTQSLQSRSPSRRRRSTEETEYLWADGAPNDEALLARIAQGRAGLDAAFEALVRAYQDRLYAFALRLSGSRSDAEEAAQDAFVRAYQALTTYPPERILMLRLRPWLYQITLNVCRNLLRSRRRHSPPTDSLDLSREQDGDDGQRFIPDEPADDDASAQPEQAFELAEQRAELGDLVAALPLRYRAAVILRHIEGHSYAEMSQTLEQPIGTIKANVHRGVAQLRAALSPATDQHPVSDTSPDTPSNTSQAILYPQQEVTTCH